VSRGEPRTLYGYGGYKVWLGAVGVDDTTLLSDGADNCVIVHKFDEDGGGGP